MVISLQEHNGGVIIDKPPHNMTARLLSKQTIHYPDISDVSIPMYNFSQVLCVNFEPE